MKKIRNIAYVTLAVILSAASCETEPIEANFEDVESMSIYNFLEENDSLYGNFMKILEAGHVAKTLSAYNPYNQGYTLLLPDSLAVERYIDNHPDYNTLQDLLDDTEFVKSLAEYHVVNLAIDANDFPFGALPVTTMTDDYLTVSFAVTADSGYYMINNQAPVVAENIEMSNGFIHILGDVLSPITFTASDWLKDHDDYSIFNAAVDATGFNELLSKNIKEDSIIQSAITLLIEPDSVYNRNDIYSLEDLAAFLEEEGTDYTARNNRLFQYVGYHILDANAYLDDFYDNATNYTTFSDLPLNINGEDYIDIVINKGKQTFDTLLEDLDTTFIDFITFFYDESNINTLSGPIHIINQVMTPQQPSRARLTFEFWGVPEIAALKNDDEPGEYPFDDPGKLTGLDWVGPDPVFIIEADDDHPAWGNDYMLLEGNFSITRQLPKIVQGEYLIQIRGHCADETNALVEVFLDGNKVGGFLDMATGGSENYPYQEKTAGSVTLSSYETHEVEIRALIPGRFEWDYLRFEPVTD